MAEEATHPSGITVKVVGIDRGDRGRSCEEHNVCGTVVEEDTLLHLRKEQILVDGQEETAISCYWVTDGIDRCCIGFLKCHMVKHAGHFDGALVQVMKIFSADPHVSDTAERKMHHQNHGCTLGTIVLAIYEIKKNCITTTESLQRLIASQDQLILLVKYTVFTVTIIYKIKLFTLSITK
jgi:hypothetical protein